MPQILKNNPWPLLCVLAAAIPVALVFLKRPAPAPPPAPVPPPPSALSVLAERPDWSALETFQSTITRHDFERLLNDVFTTGESWRQFISMTESEAVIQTQTGDPPFHLIFATSAASRPTPRHWRTRSELPPAAPDRALDGLRITIDPGHIGGEWARMEERWFTVGNGTPVCEGDMTLKVARLLKPLLEEKGAVVSLVRDRNEPVTLLRPETLLSAAADANEPQDSPGSLRKFAERLFYRTAEIRARAALVNTDLKPDLVLCLHFNAEAWGDPNNPTLVERNHLHLLLNGAYTNEEVSLADQRFALLHKLLQRTHEEEVSIGATVAEVFATTSGLPAYQYPPDSANVRPIAGQPYLWARNLLANRLYDCPVIFMEPYVMNSTTDYARIQAGDYEGTRESAGVARLSIFREYASALADGLSKHYAARIRHDEITPAPGDMR